MRLLNVKEAYNGLCIVWDYLNEGITFITFETKNFINNTVIYNIVSVSYIQNLSLEKQHFTNSTLILPVWTVTGAQVYYEGGFYFVEQHVVFMFLYSFELWCILILYDGLAFTMLLWEIKYRFWMLLTKMTVISPVN